MNKYVIVILILIVAIVIVGSLTPSSQEINNKTTYETSWYEPSLTETGAIGTTFSRNGIRGCGEFQIKVIQESEYLVACTSDGGNWIYYMVYTNANKVQLASNKMKGKLSPPR